jgi:hypothetical protein
MEQFVEEVGLEPTQRISPTCFKDKGPAISRFLNLLSRLDSNQRLTASKAGIIDHYTTRQ